MPGPFTVVTFVDADGDEFPVRIGGHPKADEAINAGYKVAYGLIREGEWRPNGDLKYDHQEYA